MLDPPTGSDIDNRLLERRDAITADDIVLAQCQTGRTRRDRAQTAGVLQGEELEELRLGRLGQVDLTEVDDGVGVRRENDIAG